MTIGISFKKIGYVLQIGQQSGTAQQVYKISFVKEYYDLNEDGVLSVVWAKLIFAFGGKK